MAKIIVPNVISYEEQTSPHHPSGGARRLEIETQTPGSISDGYHSIDDLYMHRNMLFCALAERFLLRDVYKSKLHHDGTSYPGWFIAGIILPNEIGHITYHLPMELWDLFPGRKLEKAPEWDGHTSEDVIQRLKTFIR